MSDYENAPATTMLATHCCCCGRPLLDAVSVEAGIGPDCRKKHGFGEAQAAPDWAAVARLELEGAWPTDPHAWANSLVHRIACNRSGDDVPRFVACIHALGYRKLAMTIAVQFGAVIVTEADGMLLVAAPFNDEWNKAAHANWWRWDGKAKVRRVPVADRGKLWAVLVRVYPGVLCVGTKTARIIEAKAA